MSKTKIKKPQPSFPKFTVKTAKKADLPDYVIVNGVYYEKITGKTVNVELDLEPSVNKQLTQLVKEGKYVNTQDAVRDILRSMIKDHEKQEARK